MTQTQSAALAKAAQNLIAASATNDMAQAAAKQAYADFQSAHDNAVRVVPAENQKRQAEANQASIDAEANYVKVGDAARAAQATQSQAQIDLNQATLDSLQTGAQEMMPAPRRQF